MLEEIGLDFSVVHPRYEEDNTVSKEPAELVKIHSLEKARSVKGDIVIGSDCVVYDGEILGKPKDADDIRKTLRRLSGKKHTVFAGVAVIHDGKEYVDHDTAEVEFDKLSDEMIEAYIESGEPFGKAGSYKMHGKGSLFVKRVCGDHFSVIGMPLFKLVRILHKIGVKII